MRAVNRETKEAILFAAPFLAWIVLQTSLPATAACYAAYLEYVRQYGPTPDCLIAMTGAGLKSEH